MTPMFVDQYANDRISQRMSAAEDHRRVRVARDRQHRTKRQSDVAGPERQARLGEAAPAPLTTAIGRLLRRIAAAPQALRRDHPVAQGVEPTPRTPSGIRR